MNCWSGCGGGLGRLSDYRNRSRRFGNFPGRRDLPVTSIPKPWPAPETEGSRSSPAPPVDRYRLVMALTKMIGDKDSPLRLFLNHELPDLKQVRADARRTHPADADPLLPQPPEGQNPAPGTIGAAIDHRLRYSFNAGTPQISTVKGGIKWSSEQLQGSTFGTREALPRLGAELIADLTQQLTQYRPDDRTASAVLEPSAEDRLIRSCYVSALFEEILRSGRVSESTSLGGATSSTTLEGLLESVPDYAVRDIAAVTALATSGLGPYRDATTPDQVVTGPNFAGSRSVGGADADLIIDGLLLDLKASRNVSAYSLADLYQLAGYALLDYPDEHRITRVGFYLARIGHLVSWPVADYFRLLGARKSLAELRADTQNLLTP